MGMKNDQILNVLIYDDDGSSDDKYKIWLIAPPFSVNVVPILILLGGKN
jgi:hypothetical protein